MRTVWVIFFIVFAGFGQSNAQNRDQIPADILTRTWDAYWITHPVESGTDYGVFHFRRSFHIDSLPDSFVVHLSGDTRYRFFVNGVSVVKGPAAGDKHHWRFETVDIAPFLSLGENTVAATVWNFGEFNALQHHFHRTAFILQGNSERESILNTGHTWKVLKNGGYSPIPVTYQDVDGYYAAPHGERFDAANYPHGWKTPLFDDTEWHQVRLYQIGQPRGTSPYGNLYGWSLIPREIPFMEESVKRMQSVRRTDGIDVQDGFLKGEAPLVIPERSRASLLLDQGFITNAYPVLNVSGGDGASIKLTYAESLRYADNSKGNRNEIEGKTILGFYDLFHPDGTELFRFQTLWLRSYRYIKLEIETAEEPLVIHDLHGLFTAYPFEENGWFLSSDTTLTDIWEAGWRTARINAFETYWDCAYYEQLQYVGDTRIQALISLYVSGDDRLMRNAISQFDQSRMPDGITMSRYPSHHPQYIPPYSLLWIAMVHDYWMHRSDDEFISQFFPGIRSVIRWFESHIDDELGILGPMPWWNYVDAADGFSRGTPPGADEGHSIVISLQLLYALQYALELAEAYEQQHDTARYRELIGQLELHIPKQGWDSERNLMADTPDRDRFSQHATILAVLTGIIPADEQAGVMKRILEYEELVQATYYFRFYLNRAMNAAGLGNEYLSQLDPWYDALALGMTTFPEHPEPTRSDAHAWSASPNYDFLATVAGIRPDSPGFRSVLIEPQPGHLEWIEAAVPHPDGEIQLAITIEGDGMEAVVTLPEGIEGRFVWNGIVKKLNPGEQIIRYR